MDPRGRVVGSAPPVPFESLDFLSRNYAIQVFRETPTAGSYESQKQMVFEGNVITKFSSQEKDRMGSVRNVNCSSVPPWKTEDLESWIWLQQMIHPEMNLNRYFTKKWKLPKLFHGQSIKAWLTEIKIKKKEESRLQRAELHAAISVAGVAAALAAVATENARKKGNCELQQRKQEEKEDEEDVSRARDAVLASAAAIVAAQCVEAAQSMGAKKDQLDSIIESALTVKDAGDLITLTAAAATCNQTKTFLHHLDMEPLCPTPALRGAATLRARAKGKETMQLLHHSNAQGINDEAARPQDVIAFDFLRGRDLLASGSLLTVTTEKGKCKPWLVSIILKRETKVVLRTRKNSRFNLFAVTKESIIVGLHSWPQERTNEEDPPYLIVIETDQGMVKLEMNDDASYKLWSMTISHMLMISSSYSEY